MQPDPASGRAAAGVTIDEAIVTRIGAGTLRARIHRILVVQVGVDRSKRLVVVFAVSLGVVLRTTTAVVRTKGSEGRRIDLCLPSASGCQRACTWATTSRRGKAAPSFQCLQEQSMLSRLARRRARQLESGSSSYYHSTVGDTPQHRDWSADVETRGGRTVTCPWKQAVDVAAHS